VLGPIAAREGKIACPIGTGEVVMLNQADGAILWRQHISGSAAVFAGPAFTGKYVYAVSKDGYLAVLDAKDGAILEKHFLNSEGKPGEKGLCVSSPTIVNGLLFVGSETGGIRCFMGGKVIQ
jgi:outer membrane protein assembly factor BamB